MRSRLLTCFALLILLSLCAGMAHAANLNPGDTVYAYCGSRQGYVYLYDSPATFQILANVKCGEKLTVVSLGQTWVLVRTADGKQGYLQYSDLGVLTTPQTSPAAPPAPAPSAQPPAPQSAPAMSQPNRRAITAQSNAQPAAPQPSPQPAVTAPNQEPLVASLNEQPVARAAHQPLSVPQAAVAPAPLGSATPHSTQDLELASAVPASARPPLSVNVAALPPEPPQPAFTPAQPVARSSRQAGWPGGASRFEFSGGYSFLNIDTNGTLASRLNVSGFSSSATVNVKRWIGVEGGVSGYFRTYAVDTTTAGLGVVNLDLHDYNFLAGPRLNFHPFFFHVLVGTDRLSGAALGAASSQSSLSGAIGGGMEHKISRHIAITGSADYIFARHDILNFLVPGGPMYSESNIRVSGGIAFNTGSSVR